MAPFQAPTRLLRQLLVHEQDRRCHVSSHIRQAAFPSRSRDVDPSTRRHAFGLWVSLRHPIFTTGSMPFWLADAAIVTTALSVLFSFQYFLRLCPRDALHRFTALSGHWPFPKRSKERGGRSQRLQGQSPKTSQRLEKQSLKQSSRPGLSSVTGRVKASGSPVELACLSQRDRTSEVFW